MNNISHFTTGMALSSNNEFHFPFYNRMSISPLAFSRTSSVQGKHQGLGQGGRARKCQGSDGHSNSDFLYLTSWFLHLTFLFLACFAITQISDNCTTFNSWHKLNIPELLKFSPTYFGCYIQIKIFFICSLPKPNLPYLVYIISPWTLLVHFF